MSEELQDKSVASCSIFTIKSLRAGRVLLGLLSRLGEDQGEGG